MPDNKEKKGTVVNIPKEKQRPPFVPETGNPENGDYLDWFRCIRKSAEPLPRVRIMDEKR